MSILHRCRLCLKLSRNKIPIFKDDFPKMIEILTGLRVDPNDDFPKTSCLDCANNVKIALRTKKQIVRSHKTLLEEFLAKCRESTEVCPANTINYDSKDTDKVLENDVKDNISSNLNNSRAKNIDITKVGDSLNKKNPLTQGTVTRSQTKCNKLSENTVANSCMAKEEDTKHLLVSKVSKSEKLLNDTDKNQTYLTTKQELSSDESNGEPSYPMSDSASDVDWVPDNKEEESIKPEKKKPKSNLKSSDGVFFVKKRNVTTSKKSKTAETVIRIKKKPKDRTAPTRVTCEICKKEVKSYWLKKHMETHEYNPVTCEFCGLVSKSPTALRHHVFYYHRSAADEYMCDQCGRSFRSKYRLNLHKKKEHGGTKDFECTTCGKKFFERMHLKRHVDKTHKNIRPYVCDFCGKCFKSRNHIKIHERIHSKEAPYICHMCGESFKMKLTLRTHLKGVHNVQEVQKVFCDICKRGFASDIALKAHVNSRIHETEKCQYCSEMFTREYMVNHLRDVHAVEETTASNKAVVSL